MEYYPAKISWSTNIYDLVVIDAITYTLIVSPLNINEHGADTAAKAVGFYVIDCNGFSYKIIEINVDGNPEKIKITDELGFGIPPQPQQQAFIYESVGDGDSPILPPVDFNRLDKTALANSYGTYLEILWRHSVSEDIILTNVIPSIENYDTLYAPKYGQSPKLVLLITNGNNEEESQQVPIRYKTGGLITRIAWDMMPDPITGKIIISK